MSMSASPRTTKSGEESDEDDGPARPTAAMFLEVLRQVHEWLLPVNDHWWFPEKSVRLWRTTPLSFWWVSRKILPEWLSPEDRLFNELQGSFRL